MWHRVIATTQQPCLSSPRQQPSSLPTLLHHDEIMDDTSELANESDNGAAVQLDDKQ